MNYNEKVLDVIDEVKRVVIGKDICVAKIMAAIIANGCDFIQGFYFSRVLPGREAESFLRSLAARDREDG